MSTTPRTDAHIDGLRRDPEVSGCDRTLNFCRQLERELNAAKLDAEDQAEWALRYLARAEKAEAELATERARHNALRRAVLDVLCDPEGRACFHGSNADRDAIDAAMKEGSK